MNYLTILATLLIFFNIIAQTTENGVFGRDDRILISQDNKRIDHEGIGLLVKYENNPQVSPHTNFSTCTATLFKDKFLITAAHCVSKGLAIYPSFLFEFYPSHNVSNTIQEKLQISNMENHIYVPEQYWKLKKKCLATGNDSICSSNKFDIAIVRLKDSNNYHQSELLPFPSKEPLLLDANISGYPSSKVFENYKKNELGIPPVFFNKYFLYSTSGEISVSQRKDSSLDQDVSPLHIRSKLDITEGMSGAAIKDIDGNIIGIVSGYVKIKTSTGGILTDSEGRIVGETPVVQTEVEFNLGVAITPDILTEIQEWM